MKLVIMFMMTLAFSVSAHAEGTDYDCKSVTIEGISSQVCFPIDHVCMDGHGIGDGNPIQIDCFTGGTRMCHNGSENWPSCAGGIIANTCKEVSIDSKLELVCFPAGHVCLDPHGIGDGNPIQTDCFTGGSRVCHNGSANWPSCAGGKVVE